MSLHQSLSTTALLQKIALLEAELEHAQQQRVFYQRQFETVFHAQHLKHLLIDRSTLAIIDANAAACLFYGYTQNELCSRSIIDLCAGAYIHSYDLINQINQTDIIEFFQHCYNGRVRYVQATRTPLEFTDQSIELWTITDLSEHQQIELQQKLHHRYMVALHEATLAVMAHTSLEETLQTLLDQVTLLVEGAIGSVFLLSQDSSVMELRWSTIEPVVRYVAVERGAGFIGSVWQAEQTVVVDEYTFCTPADDPQAVAIYAAIGIPLWSAETMVGILALAYNEPYQHFGQAEIEILEQAGRLASLAIERSRLYSTLETELIERRMVEQSLRKMTERFQLVEEVTASGIFDVDLQSERIFTTLGFLRTFGYSASDITTELAWWREHIHPEDAKHVIQAYINAMRQGDYDFRATFRFQHKLGAYCYVQTMLKFIRDDHQRVVRIVGSLVDTTKQQEAEIARLQSDQRYRLLVEHAPYPIAVVHNKQIIYVNNVVLQLMGAQSLDTLLEVDSAQTFINHVNTYFKTTTLVEGQVYQLGIQEYRDARQQIIFIDLVAVGIIYEAQLAVLVIGHDVTERIKAESNLRAHVEQYRRLIEMAPMPIVIHAGATILYVNIRGLEGAGLSAATNIIGQPLHHFVHPEDHPVLDVYLQQPIQPYQTFRFIRADGAIRTIEVSSTQVTYGAEPATQTIINDITTRILAEEERLKFERRMLGIQRLESLGVLAGGIAHDFNNLLVAILGNAALALDMLDEQAPVTEIVSHITQAARRAAELTHQMLVYSGHSVTTPTSLDLGQIVYDILELLRVSIAKSARLIYDIPAEPLVVQGDSAQLSQVIMNLVINASDALQGSGGEIRIVLGHMHMDEAQLQLLALAEPLAPGSYVFLDVLDSGEGMDAETQMRMFDPFFTTKFTGRGLGLAAVQGIIRSHRGAIKVSSVRHQGTAIRVLLPHYLQQPQLPVSKAVVMTKETETQGTMLVVDDEPDVRMVVERILRRLGFDVLSASNGYTAIQLFQEHQARIIGVLLDLTMPDMDGATTLHELRQIDPQLKVILMSGYNEQQIMEQFPDQYLVGFLPKPFMINDLKARLAALLEHN